MAVVKVHVRRDVSQRATFQFVTLEGQRVGLKHRYSALEDRWYQWIADTSGAVIIGPIKLVPGMDLWAPYHYDPRVPPGELFVHGDPPDKDNVDITSHLLYREST